MSTTLRVYTLRLLRRAGVRRFRCRSGLGHDCICFLGDFLGELPYCNRDTGRTELLLMTAWCRQTPGCTVLDVGGNVGFFATQLAQLLETGNAQVFSFEPSPFTFRHLVDSVRLLRLEGRVHPVCCALSDEAGLVCVAYDQSDTMRGHVLSGGAPLARQRLAWAASTTLDAVVGSLGATPALVKVDVEGHEVRVLRGARGLLASRAAPALLFEWNPETLSAAGFSTADLAHELGAFRCFYVDDFEGQRIPFGRCLPSLESVDWVCNLFAIPDTADALHRYELAVSQAQQELVALRAAYR